MCPEEQSQMNTQEEKKLPVTEDTLENAKELLEETASKLRVIQEKMQLRLHLAGMEAKDLRLEVLNSLGQIGHKLQEYAYELDKNFDSGNLQVRLGLMEAREHWDEAKKELLDLLEILNKDQRKAKDFLEGLRMQAKLAQHDTADFIREAREDLQKGVREFNQQTGRNIRRFNESVRDLLRRFEND